MQVILTGATGLVGSATLSHILSLSPSAASSQHISRLSILSRNPDVPLLSHPKRPTSNTHTAIEVIPHADFTTYPEQLLSKLKSSSTATEASPVAVIWALGMSQNDARSTEQYTEVTKTYALNAARAFASAFSPQQVNFVYVSGEGATTNPGRFTPLFGRVKGETERELRALAETEYANLRVYNVRPGGVDAGDKVGGQQAVNEIWEEKVSRTAGWGYSLAKGVLLPVMRAGLLGRGMHSPTAEVGRVLVGLGVGEGRALKGSGIEDGGWTVRNVGLRRLAREME